MLSSSTTDLTAPPLQQGRHPFYIPLITKGIYTYCTFTEMSRFAAIHRSAYVSICEIMSSKALQLGIAQPHETPYSHREELRALWRQLPLFLQGLKSEEAVALGLDSSQQEMTLDRLRALPLPDLLPLLERIALAKTDRVVRALLAAPHSGEMQPSTLLTHFIELQKQFVSVAPRERAGLFALLLDRGLFREMPEGEIATHINLQLANLVRLLLDRGYIKPNTMCQFSNPRPLLHDVVGDRNGAVTTRLLLQRGADPNLKDPQGRNALFFLPLPSNGRDNSEAVHRLLNAKTDLPGAVAVGLLHALLRYYHLHAISDVEQFEALLCRGAPPNIKDRNGRTPLFFCPYESFITLLKRYGADLNHRDHGGRTALSYRAEHSVKQPSNASAGPQVESRNLQPYAGVEEFLRAGADPNIVDYQGNTPLFYASRCQDIEALLAYKVDAFHLNRLGQNALAAQILRPNVTIDCCRLLEKHYDRSSDSHGHTALHLAVLQERIDIVELLLPTYRDLNSSKNEHGQTPLHLAVIKGSVALSTLLLKHGASPTLADYDGKTAIELARGHTELKKLLLAHQRARLLQAKMSQCDDSESSE